MMLSIYRTLPITLIQAAQHEQCVRPVTRALYTPNNYLQFGGFIVNMPVSSTFETDQYMYIKSSQGTIIKVPKIDLTEKELTGLRQYLFLRFYEEIRKLTAVRNLSARLRNEEYLPKETQSFCEYFNVPINEWAVFKTASGVYNLQYYGKESHFPIDIDRLVGYLANL